jgi:cyclase
LHAAGVGVVRAKRDNSTMETMSIDENMKVYKGGGCNSTVLNSKDGRTAIVVDTKYFRGAKELRRKVTANEVTIINTHFHLDHARGNRFYPDATVISGFTNWKQWDFDTAHSKHPDKSLTPGETLRIELDGEIIDVIDLGPAHSPNDIVVYFEKRRVLAAGDLVSVNMHPILLDGNTKLHMWKGYLDSLYRDREIEMVVPGHGDVSGKDAILNMARYLGSITEALDNKGKMEELKEKYGKYKGFPIFGSFRRTVRLLRKEERRAIDERP